MKISRFVFTVITLAVFALATSPVAAVLPPNPNRTVMAGTEEGYFFGWPTTTQAAKIGALVFMPQHMNTFGAAMPAAALKISHGRMNSFGPSDETSNAWFPWAEFVQFNQSEIAQGRPSMLITANGGTPVGTQYGGEQPRQAVNVGDERFIDFWINRYVRRRIFANPSNAQPYPYQNMWVGIDEAIFQRGWYTPGSGWDQPFPQTEQEYVDSIAYFFKRVKELAPEIKILANSGTVANELNFPKLYENIDGYTAEDFAIHMGESTWHNQDNRMHMRRLIWYADRGKVGLPRVPFTSTAHVAEEMKDAYLAYLIARGDNFFFSPVIGADLVSTDSYKDMQEKLGWHTARPEEVATNFWRRDMQGGMVLLNWSDTDKTYTLPAGYTNAAGQPVTSVSIPKYKAEYVLKSASSSTTSSSTSSVCRKADFNGDNVSDIADFKIFSDNYKRSGINCALDLAGNNCYLDLADFSVFVQLYKKPVSC